ncbi:MAG: hypothetical protein GC192_04010 [Bacteroidetes bacterium]|nr:hypothetical protein [Bacteroidota bacterium]
MKSLWFFLINTFEVNTRGSRRKMLRIANYHLSRLQAMKSDPAILVLFDLFEPAVLLYRSMFSNLDSAEGISISNTAQFTRLLDEMSDTYFDDWQTMVRQEYGPDTTEFKAIFPHGKAPFQRSQYDLRMVAVEALHTTLLTFPSLSAVADDVAAQLTLLRAARDTQTEGFGTNAFTANMIEQQRLVLANLMDDNLCDLKKKYRPNIKMVENFFDLAELRKSSSDADAQFAFSGAVEAGVTSAVPVPDKLLLSANASCIFGNKSNLAELEFFFSANASAADNPVKTPVMAMQSVQVNAAESGWAPGAKFIIVKNLGTVTAEFELRVVEAIEN